MSLAPATYDAIEWFRRPLTLTTTPEAGPFGWTSKKTGSGTPTFTTVNGGGLAITLSPTSEAQVAAVYQNNILPFTLAELQRIEFIAKVSGIDPVTTLAFGIAAVQNDTLDSITHGAWFRMEGSASTSLLVVETDDSVTDDDDNATGVSLASANKLCVIDFVRGLSDIRFFVDGAKVGTGTFSMAGAAPTQGIQFLTQIQKASGTGTPSVTIGKVRFRARATY